ncbi:MAG: alpha/beta fold hydrolase, partial [Caldilineaceae bacterium]|nr:alpha/beta fold hydrolase [Caldilineaceae bacterium]
MTYPQRMFSLMLLVILLSSLITPVVNISESQVVDSSERMGQGYPWLALADGSQVAKATASDEPVFVVAPGQPEAAPQVSFAATGTFLNLAQLPLSFVSNVGQWDPGVVFQAVGLGSAFYFTPDALLLALPVPTFTYAPNSAQPTLSLSRDQGSMVQLLFENANPSVQLRARQLRPGRSNFLLGRDPNDWRTDVPTYAEIIYADLYPQIDLHYAGAGVSLKGTYVISPGGDPIRIRWHYEGAAHLQIEQASGDLLIGLSAPVGTKSSMHFLREHAPAAWQTIAGRRVPVAVAYRLDEDGYVGFDLPNGYEPARPLIIDPTLTYSTFLGGSGHDRAWGIGRDGLGNIYVTGQTYSANFPTTPNAWDATCNSCVSSHSDVFVFKLNPEGSELIYSTFLGGSGDDNSYSAGAIAVDAVGNAYLTGYTASADFPLVGAIQNEFDVNGNAFVTKLSSSGSALHYSTYLGGNGRDIGYGIAVDVDGNAYVTGAASGGFPLVDPLRFSFGDDAFVAKVNPAGSALVYSTYLGGSTLDTGFGIAVDWEGNAYVTGSTLSDDFPVVGGVQAQRSGSGDVFVSKLDRTGRSLVYSTYLGGSNGDGASAIAVDGEGNAVITGSTSSQDFPTTAGAFQTTYGGHRSDAFVAKVNAAGNQLVFATYLGGSDDENFFDASASIAVDAEGSIYVTGSTVSSDFPLVDPLQADMGIGGAAYVAKLSPAGTAIYSTFLGGTGREAGHAIAVDDAGTAYVTGETESVDFPTVDPLQGSYGGGPGDVFVAKISHGPGRSVEFDPPYLIFGLYEAGESAPAQTITVYNVGSAPLPIGSVTLIGSHASDFAITATDCDDVTLTPGQTCTVHVSFTPTASGLRFAQVALESATWAGPRVVGLRGRGAATLDLTAESLDLGYQKRGTIGASRTVTLTNVGAGPLAFTVALAGLHPDDFQLTTTCVAPGLAAGASCTVSVAFKPTEDGRRYARILIQGPDFQQPTIIALNGIGGPAPVLTSSRIDTCISGQLTLSGSNFPYDAAAGVNVIKVHFDDSEVATAHLAKDGTFTSSIRVPQGVAGGPHTITAFKMATPDVQATTTVHTMETDLPIIFIPGASGSTLVADSIFLYTAPPDPALYLPIPDPRQLLPAPYPYVPGQVMWLDSIGAAATFSGNYRYFDALRLQEDGVSPMPDIFGVVPNVRVGDVLWDVLWFIDIYRGLREFLTQQTYPDGSKRYVEGQTLFYYPYDWRKDLTPTAAALNTLIDEARQKSGKDKVVIVAHSMGGLVARNYLLRYGTKKVDQVITMGTPYLGSVLALKVLEIGDHWGMGWHPFGDTGGDLGIGMHPKQMMKLAQNMGGAYELFTPPAWYGADALDPHFDPRYVVRSSIVDGKSIEEKLGQRETAQFADDRHNAYL